MKEDRILRSRAAREYAGLGLAAFLARRFPYHTEREWDGLAAEGMLRVNGAQAEPGLAIAAGDLVEYAAKDRPEPPVDLSVNVLYEDGDIIAVDKPGNLPVHPAGRYFRHTLWWLLREKFGVAEPGILNRLDRETSGVTLVAKNRGAGAACRRQFDARSVKKKYTVLVEGSFPAAAVCRGYMLACAASPVRKKRRFEACAATSPRPELAASWAETGFRLLRSGGGVSAVEAEPRTGRLHQIRATLLALGFPVVGDKVYGVDDGIFPRFLEDRMTAADRAALRIGRQALHAASIEFIHPSDGRRMFVGAPLPADMAALLPGLPA